MNIIEIDGIDKCEYDSDYSEYDDTDTPNFTLSIVKTNQYRTLCNNEKNIMTLKLLNLTHFLLFNMDISDIACILLKDALITNKTITKIDLQLCDITDIGALALAEVLNSENKNKGHGNKTITTFYLNNNYGDNVNIMGKIGMEAFMDAVFSSEYLLYFGLEHNKDDAIIYDSKAVLSDLEQIINNNKIILGLSIINFIDFSMHNFDSNDWDNKRVTYRMIEFAVALEKTKTLEYLDLSKNNINDEFMKIINNGLVKNTSLKHLILKDNNIGNQGMTYLADYIKNNKSLEYISLCKNSFDISGLKTFIEGLQFNSTLLECNIFDSLSFGCDTLKLEKWLKNEQLVYEDGTIIDDDYMESIVNILPNIKSIIVHELKNYKNCYSNYLLKNCMNTDNNKSRILLKFENLIDKNYYVYENVYWNPWYHLSFKNIGCKYWRYGEECHQLVMSTLVCNSYLQIKLSIYLWQYIFSFYRRGQFTYVRDLY